MSAQDDILSLRKSFRCPIADVRQEAVMKVGDARIAVRLVDESAGGFAIEACNPPPLKIGDVFQLWTDTGWFEVQLANFAPIETPCAEIKESASGKEEETPPRENSAPPFDANEATSHGGDPTFRLGLRRLNDLVAPDDTANHSIWSLLRLHFSQFSPTGGSYAASGVIFSVLAIGGMLAIVVLLASIKGRGVNLDQLSARDDPPSRESTLFSPSAESNNRTHPSESSSGLLPNKKESPASKIIDSIHDQGLSQLQKAKNAARDFSKSISDLPGAASLVLPEVAGVLKLTEAQLEHIRGFVEETSRAIQDLDVMFPGASRQELSKKRMDIFDNARRLALETLTETQLIKWNELFGQNGAAQTGQGEGKKEKQ
jgi:hypothetical protein